MKKRLVACLMAAVTALSCVGCGESSETESKTAFTPRLDTEAETTINIIGVMGNFESLEAVISDFAEYYPNVEVLYTSTASTEEYTTTLASRLTSDDSVGLFMIKDLWYTEGVQDLCVNLAEEDIDLSAIQPEVISSSTVDGKLYQIPLAHNATGLIVNQTLLADQGLELPTNYREFLETCETLKQAGYTPLQGSAGMVNSQFLSSMSFVLINNEFSSESGEGLDALIAGEDGSADLLQPVFDIENAMYENGYLDHEVNETYEDAYNDAILKFFEGDVPFLVGTTETFSGTKKRETKSEHFSAEPFEYAFMTTPLAEKGAYCYLENWYGFAVSEKCANKEWAIEFLRFLVTEEEINELAYVKGMPSVAVETDDDRFIGLYSDQDEYYCTTDTYFPAEVQNALWAAEIDLACGRITVNQATDEMERRIRESDFAVESD